MPGLIVRRRGGRTLGARANGWVKRAVATGKVAQKAWSTGQALAKAVKKSWKRTKKPAKSIQRSGAAPRSVEPQTIVHGYLSLRLAKPRKGVKSLGRWVYTQQNNGRVIAGLGLQGASVILGHNTISQLLVDTTSPNGLQFKDDVYAMNPYQTNTGSSNFPSQVAPSQDRIMCRSVRTRFMFSNTSDAPAIVTLYWILSIKAHKDTPFDRWTAYLQETALGQGPATQPIQSDSTFGPGQAGVPSFAVYGQEPTTVAAWNKNFKLLRKRTFYLGFGACQTFNYNIAVNKMFDKTIATQNNALASTAYPGGTVWLGMVVRGTPVDISLKATGADTLSVTTSGPEIAWTASCEYTYTGTPANRLDVNRVTQGFPGLSGALVDAELMGPNAVPVFFNNA